MVLQLSLVSAIDDESYDLCTSTLCNLSGNPPVLFSHFTAMLKPNPTFDIEQTNSKNQLIEQNRLKLCKEVPLDQLEPDGSKRDYEMLKNYQDDKLDGFNLQVVEDMLHGSTDLDRMDVDEAKSDDSWILSIADIPAAGSNRKVSTQSITENTILSSGGSSPSIIAFLSEFGYVPDYQFLTLGVKFNMNHSVYLELSKVWLIQGGESKQITKGGFLVKAFVNVTKGTDIKSINHGTNALLNLQKELSGYIDLTIPDRKSMDSRLENLSDI
ncbi:LANO_0F09824g1_1 [Lachancea nothofagi CBS 11611]|uniref:Mediator of RNA polymerase II transcription subunit 18 n=1 Tax=Lachancea nothofagi CBS 11611 TaxID=1266666 RepID=A0A1G4KA96_9SACH|nr:LANO_0F09824g1_1 [Lachancea nothofagi CBS 11611]